MKLRNQLDQLKSDLKDLRLILPGFFRHGLRLHDFTALFGCKDSALVRQLLAAQDASQPYRGIYGLHNLRWLTFDPSQKNGVQNLDPLQTHALVLSFVCDGNVGDVLAALAERNQEQLRELFRHCHGFDASADLRGYIEHHSVPSGYLFRDLGPLHESWDPAPDPTRLEIEDAAAAQKRFEHFYAAHGERSPQEIRAALLDAFANDGFPLPLTRFERRVVGEEQAVRRFSDTARKQQDQGARASADRLIRRPIHAKAHGLIQAKFQVQPLAKPEYRVGLFARQSSYDALLRPSNGVGLIRPDEERDARGLAMRVLLPPSQAQFVLPQPPGQERCQDFVLMNASEFFAPDIQKLSLWFDTQRDESSWAKAAGMAALVLGEPGALRVAGILLRTFSSRLSHPLRAAYHSASPYALGAEHVTKYSLEPTNPKRLHDLMTNADGNYLSTALAHSLRRQPIELKLYLHVLSGSVVPRGFRSLADIVEDATLDWRRLGAEKVHAATIRIGAQDPASTERMTQAEHIRFNPWNALAEHRPLGSLNRARLSAYRASQRYRSVELPSQQARLQNAAE
jgi:hypothetical protein